MSTQVIESYGFRHEITAFPSGGTLVSGYLPDGSVQQSAEWKAHLADVHAAQYPVSAAFDLGAACAKSGTLVPNRFEEGTKEFEAFEQGYNLDSGASFVERMGLGDGAGEAGQAGETPAVRRDAWHDLPRGLQSIVVPQGYDDPADYEFTEMSCYFCNRALTPAEAACGDACARCM